MYEIFYELTNKLVKVYSDLNFLRKKKHEEIFIIKNHLYVHHFGDNVF